MERVAYTLSYPVGRYVLSETHYRVFIENVLWWQTGKNRVAQFSHPQAGVVTKSAYTEFPAMMLEPCAERGIARRYEPHTASAKG